MYPGRMSSRFIAGSVFGLVLVSIALDHTATGFSTSPKQQVISPSPEGPFRVEGNRILDSKGRPFVMWGTQLTPFHAETAAADNRSGIDFGPHSPTSLSAIRLRFNMNTVRVPVSVAESSRPAYFAELEKTIRRITGIDMLAIVSADEPSPKFWAECAARFKNSPNVMFEVAPNAADIRAIRSVGAAQLIIVRGTSMLFDGPSLIYEASADYLSGGEDRDKRFGELSARVPVIATLPDLGLDSAAECAAVPADPSKISARIQADLDYFDAHNISWIASEYKPGKLIKDLSLQDATSLENGWTCGQTAYAPPGMGRLIEAHLRATEERGMFVVSAGGGPDLPRGGFAMAYGPAMASQDSQAVNPQHLPKVLGGISVQITDSRGITRPAGILWAHAGWGQVNYVVPPESATGPAKMTVVRADGSSNVSNITVADFAPGFWTGVSCRGPALGFAKQVFADGRTISTKLSECKGVECHTLPIPVADGARTTIQLVASGFRYAASAADIEVMVGGVRVPVVSYGPAADEGVDQVTVEIPTSLRNLGEADLICHVKGRVSNAVQVHIGAVAGRGRSRG
jgi:uncharacterized protein (TIGR03437 family)